MTMEGAEHPNGSEAAAESSPSFSDELNARMRRLKVLRAAARAITPSIPGRPGRPPFEGGELASALQELAKLANQGASSEAELRDTLGPIDNELLNTGRELRELVDTIPVVQLRASLPAIERKRRLDVLALLDLLTTDPNSLNARAILLDYLITLLSTEEREGKRVVTRDPASLTPRLRHICGQSESMHGAEASVLAQEFYAAASPYGEGDIEHMIGRMRRRKQGLGATAFVPELLRAIVTYNASIANRIEHELTEAHRHADTDLLGWNDPVGDLDLTTDNEESFEWVGSAEADAGNSGSVFESAGLLAIASALKRRESGETLGTNPAERVAARLDTSALDETERRYVLEMGALPNERVLGLTITAGLVIHSMLESTLDLRELGVDLDRLQEDWAQELERSLKGVATEMIGNEAYEEACALSELKTKYLYESVASVNRRKREARTPIAVLPKVNEADVREIAQSAAPKAGQKAGLKLQHEGTAAGLRGFLQTWRTEILATVAVAFAAMAVMNITDSPAAEIKYLTSAELTWVSAHLTAGYRDGNGAGPLFVGTVGKGWADLAAEERHAEAQRMVRAMNTIGAREFMAVDSVRRLQVQGTNGRLRFPAPPR